MISKIFFICTLTAQVFAQGLSGGLFATDSISPEDFLLKSLLGSEQQAVKTTVNYPGDSPKAAEVSEALDSNITKTESVDFTLNLSPIEKAYYSIDTNHDFQLYLNQVI